VNMVNHPLKAVVIRIIAKSILLFVLINILVIWVSPSIIGRISLYNFLFQGRPRFPFGENPSGSFNLTINNLDAMFASLRLDKTPKENDEFRVFIFGDSSVWGSLLANEETLTGQLNNMGIKGCQGKVIKTYNLGYPTLSILKDLLIIDQSIKYNPDLIIWLVTLESFPRENQNSFDLLKNNPRPIQKVLVKYELDGSYQFKQPNFLDLTLIGQRRDIADLFRLQAYGVMWTATGIDQNQTYTYTPAKRDFEADESFHGNGERTLLNELSFDVIKNAFKKINIPIVMINEPILVSQGKNSSIRYNYYYPRWAYDQYRENMQEMLEKNKIPYYDFYNLIPENLFTNSAIHLNNTGERMLAAEIKTILSNRACTQ
jgi:hypothetical protein